MNSFKKTSLYLLLLLVLVYTNTDAQTATRPANWAQKIEAINLHNLHKVDDNVYRAEQPNEQAMKELSKLGIKTILNLRYFKKDKQVPEANLTLVHYKIRPGSISYTDIVTALKEINKAPKPVLVHCKYGADRTGCIIAAYNIVKHNYSKEQAIDELKNGGYNYHAKAYPNIINLLNSLDIEKLKKDVE